MGLDEREVSPAGKAILDAGRARVIQSWLLGIVGAILGGAVGWFVFDWLVGEGLYALALPGATLGLGFAVLARRPMLSGGVFCAVAAFLLTAVCEWQHFPFRDDPSFSYFLAHIYKVDSVMTLVLMALGVAFAFWFGRGR